MDDLADGEYLAQCLRYEPDTGVLIWRERPASHFKTARACRVWNTTFAGREAGTARATCRAINLDGRKYKAHRIIWLLVHGSWPNDMLDHIDGNPLNNRAENLREVSNQQNQYNRGANANNTSGFKGVFWDKPAGKWRAQLYHNRKSIFLGHYATPEDAAAAYADGAKRYAREFARV
jgi:hypothetical protein